MEIEKQMKSNPEMAKKTRAVFQFNIKGKGNAKGVWTVDLKQGAVMAAAAKPKADCTISVSDDNFVGLVSGSLNPQKAFLSGKIKVSGNIMLAQKLDSIFKEGKKAVGAGATTAPGSPPAKAAGSSGLKSEALFGEIEKRIQGKPELAKKANAVFQFNITKGGKVVSTWALHLKGSAPSVVKGPAKPKADCSLTLSDDDFVGMVSGTLNPQKAFMTGKLKISGNIMLSQKLAGVFQAGAKM